MARKKTIKPKQQDDKQNNKPSFWDGFEQGLKNGTAYAKGDAQESYDQNERKKSIFEAAMDSYRRNTSTTPEYEQDSQDFPDGAYCSDIIAEAYEKDGPKGALLTYKSLLKEMAEQPSDFINVPEYMDDNPNTNPPPPPKTSENQFTTIFNQAMAIATAKDISEITAYQAKIEANIQKVQETREKQQQEQTPSEKEVEIKGQNNIDDKNDKDFENEPEDTNNKHKELVPKESEPEFESESKHRQSTPDATSIKPEAIIQPARTQDLPGNVYTPDISKQEPRTPIHNAPDMPKTEPRTPIHNAPDMPKPEPRTPIPNAPTAANDMEIPEHGSRTGVNAPSADIPDTTDIEYGR